VALFDAFVVTAATVDNSHTPEDCMQHQQVTIRTRDGVCPTHVFKPDGEGLWPAAIFYMDGLAIRPALFDMAGRLADGGYVVLMPDLYYRLGHYEPLVPKDVFAASFRTIVGPMMASTDNQRAAEDTEAFLAYIDGRSDVAGGKIGTTGYCMGGGMSLTAAGTYPDRVAAAASFHGGRLATDSLMSPHLLVPKMEAEVYVAGADKDDSYPPAMAEQLELALEKADVEHRCEIYEGALHGWTMPDFPVYDEAAAERAWGELFDLFGRTLR
jgi:carboxymethylenebutenolidase